MKKTKEKYINKLNAYKLALVHQNVIILKIHIY